MFSMFLSFSDSFYALSVVNYIVHTYFFKMLVIGFVIFNSKTEMSFIKLQV